MEKFKLENGIRLVYEKTLSNISSICIGFNGGALEENNEFPYGTAHAVEHMVSKGTFNRTEKELSVLADSIFGFENAMTNYPYVVYYGSFLKEDFEKVLDFYSDILLNPKFEEKSFQEEKSIILEELKEWREDPYQFCEDQLLKNSFKERRIKELIIGNEKSIKSITLRSLKKFYNDYYTPENCVITIVTSMSVKKSIEGIKRFFKDFHRPYKKVKEIKYENREQAIYTDYKDGIEGAKIIYSYDINNLNKEEMMILKIFNEIFAEGTSSILFHNIRTKNSLAYDVGSNFKNEKGIKLLNFYIGTSKEKVNKVISVMDKILEEMLNNEEYFTYEKISRALKSIKLKKAIRHEMSIRLALDITTSELMYNDTLILDDSIEELQLIKEKNIKEVLNKVLKNKVIQILQ
ncbi:M16 family metallopeptidase [Clostridium tepidum]|jgi:predicted Zn-dependent peptidase|uniref:M16 family metallopeptidase n=1 Tax=Clostridium tepidum TaxID=1962263 RepID=UPI0018AA6E0A|nr:pitrilysin family protein [Clostridium tepidum]MDU6876760.1 pitrilysin family protein [Clostridium botulinum]